MAPHEAQRPAEIHVLQEQRGMDEGDWIEYLRVVFHIGDDDLELRDAAAKPRFGRSGKVGVDVDRDDAPGRAANQALESVTARTSEHCDAPGLVRCDSAGELVRDERGLSDGRESHVRLVVGQRNRGPRIRHGIHLRNARWSIFCIYAF